MHIIAVDDVASLPEHIYLMCNAPMTAQIAAEISRKHQLDAREVMGRLVINKADYERLDRAAHQSGQDLSYWFNGYIQEAEIAVGEANQQAQADRDRMLRDYAKSFGVPLSSQLSTNS